MYKFIRVLLFISVFVLSLGILATTAVAKVSQSEGYVTLGPEEVIDDDYFVTGETVLIEGTVNGDLYVTGSTVEVTGTVNGDIWAVAGVVTISGKVQDDVVVGAGSVFINGANIGDSVLAAAGTLDIDDNTTVDGGLVFGAGMVTSNATITRGITGGAGNVTLGGKIGKNVLLGLKQLRINNDTKVGGNVDYYSEMDASIASGHAISGEIMRHDPPTPHANSNTMDWARFAQRAWLMGRLYAFFSVLLVGFLMVRHFGSLTNKVADRIKDQPGTTLIWGFLGLVVTPIAIIFLGMTLIGIPIAGIVAGFYSFVLYISKIFVSILLGRWLAEQINMTDKSKYLKLTLGLLFYIILASIPVLGFFVTSASALFGLGGSMMLLKEKLSA